MGEVISVDFQRGKESELVVDCISCNEPIEGINRNDLENYPYYIDEGIGPLHHHCYKENIRATKQFAEALDERRYK